MSKRQEAFNSSLTTHHSSLLRAVAVVVAYEVFLSALPEAHAVRFGLFEGLVGGPAVVGDSVGGYERARPIRAALAVHEDGLVLLRVEQREQLVYLLRVGA